MSKKIEYKTFEFEIKDTDQSQDSGIIRGYASTFNNVDLGGDMVLPGAFRKTLRERGAKIPILADHDPTKQIGINIRAEEDSKGLRVEGKINLEVQAGREKFALAKQAREMGANMGLSIGYAAIKSGANKEKPQIRELKELALFEYSVVAFPMNTRAMITAAKDFQNCQKQDEFIEAVRDHAKSLGITPKGLYEALLRKAAFSEEHDPAEIGQSLDRLLATLKS